MSGRIAAQPLLEADDLVRWDYVFSPYFLVLTIAELGVVTIIGDARDDELLAVVSGGDMDVVSPIGISLAAAGVRAAAFHRVGLHQAAHPLGDLRAYALRPMAVIAGMTWARAQRDDQS